MRKGIELNSVPVKSLNLNDFFGALYFLLVQPFQRIIVKPIL